MKIEQADINIKYRIISNDDTRVKDVTTEVEWVLTKALQDQVNDNLRAKGIDGCIIFEDVVTSTEECCIPGQKHE